jgi:hypothetical protein
MGQRGRKKKLACLKDLSLTRRNLNFD